MSLYNHDVSVVIIVIIIAIIIEIGTLNFVEEVAQFWVLLGHLHGFSLNLGNLKDHKDRNQF